MDFAILLYLPLFLLATFFAFYIPGNILVAHLKLTRFQKVTLSISFGIVLWALQGFLFGYMHMRWLSYVYLIITFLFWIKTYRSQILSYRFSFPQQTRNRLILGILIILACIAQVINTFANGISTPNGIYFCCELDSLFHIALTNNLVTNFPPYEPGISGQILSNYHFLANLVNADLIRVFYLPLLSVQYPYMSVFITVLFACNIVTFAQLVTTKKAYAYWLLFFVFFSGDLLFGLIFIQNRTLDLHTTFLANASLLWISPPRVYATMLLFTGMSFLVLWLREKKNISLDILLICTLGSLIAFKVYVGVFALAGLAVLTLFYVKEKNMRRLFVIALTLMISLALYLPVNSGAGGFVFTGFWRFENFAGNHVFGLHDMELARYIYLSHGNWMHALFNDMIYFVVYFVFIFGTLLLSFFQTRKSLATIPNKKLHIFLISGLLVCFIFGSFFIQKTGGSNSSQFLITAMTFIAVYTALAVVYWLGKIKYKWLIILATLLVIITTAPRVILETHKYIVYFQNQEGIFLDRNKQDALAYLKNNTPKNAIILQDSLAKCLPITFFAERQTYVCLDGSPGDHGGDIDKRIALQKQVFANDTKTAAKGIAHLKQSNAADYLYLSTDNYRKRMKFFDQNDYTKKYSNEDIVILKVN